MKLKANLTMFLAVALGLFWASAASAAFTVFNSNVPAGFDQAGFIQAATVTNPADPNSGGTLTINGVKMIVPANSIIQMPANTLKWADLFDPAVSAPVYDSAIPGPAQAVPAITAGTTGLALLDNPAHTPGVSPDLPFNASVLGNVDVKNSLGFGVGAYIIGLIMPIDQDLGNGGAGFITAIDYAKGRFEVGGTLGVLGTGTVIEINDPLGRFGWAHSPDPRWSVDADNSTCVTGNGYPVGLPRFAPAGGALLPAPGEVGDPDRPYYNRPLNPAIGVNSPFPHDPFLQEGAPLQVFFMPAKGSPNAPGVTTPDPWKQAPIMIGDYIAWAGVMYKNNPAAPLDPNVPIARQTYISANTIEVDKLGIFTQPGTKPCYVTLERMVIGNGATSTTVPSNPALGIQGGVIPIFDAEPRRNITIVGFCTDSTRLVDIYAKDVNPTTGAETRRRLGTVLPQAGILGNPPRGNKGRFTFSVGKGNFLPTTRMYGAVSRTGEVQVPNQTGNIVPPQGGLVSGQYFAPMFTFQFFDAPPGFPTVPNNFQTMPFLFQGEGGNLSEGPLVPFPPFAP